jgi:citrate lyase beta subunit
MIELPRAALRADEIAEYADFFSFGTNDLTQTTLGMSRDDAEGKFLTFYLEEGVLESNPFETLDQSGVGDLMRIGVERGRATKPDIKLGICGEHGGEPRSVEFCHRLGLDYVSCSPYRVPLARLAAAQAVLKETRRPQRAASGGEVRVCECAIPLTRKWHDRTFPCVTSCGHCGDSLPHLGHGKGCVLEERDAANVAAWNSPAEARTDEH